MWKPLTVLSITQGFICKDKRWGGISIVYWSKGDKEVGALKIHQYIGGSAGMLPPGKFWFYGSDDRGISETPIDHFTRFM